MYAILTSRAFELSTGAIVGSFFAECRAKLSPKKRAKASTTPNHLFDLIFHRKQLKKKTILYLDKLQSRQCCTMPEHKKRDSQTEQRQPATFCTKCVYGPHPHAQMKINGFVRWSGAACICDAAHVNVPQHSSYTQHHDLSLSQKENKLENYWQPHIHTRRTRRPKWK